VEAAAEINGPVYIRTARLPSPVYEERPFQVGKGNVIKEGKDLVIFCCGIMLEHCLEAAEILAANGIDAAIVNHHTLKPFDDELTREYAAKCGKVFTVEEHSVIGGLGDAVASAVCGMGLEKFMKIGINDEFGQSGKPAHLLEEYGLTGKQIAEKIMNA
jgi:transketolase